MIKAIVLGIGEELTQVVNNYAFKTNRRAVVVRSVAEIGNVQPEVVVVLTHDLSFEVIEHFQGTAGDKSVVGFITANDLETLALFANRAALALQSNGVRPFENYAWLDLISKKHYHSLERRDELGYEQEIESVLTSRLDLLSILTHSDGVDAFLHKKLTLCPLLDINETDGERLPVCLINNECLRQRMPRREAKANGLLFDPRNIAASTLLLATCHGLLPPKSTVSPTWGLLNKLIEGNIHTVVTTEGACIIDHTEFLAMHNLLLSAPTVGEAIKEFNRSENSVNRSLRFILFGEPRLSLNYPHHVETYTPQSPLYMSEKFYESLAFIRAYITCAIPGCNDELLGYISEVSGALANVEYVAWTARSDKENIDKMVYETGLALIKFVSKRGQSISIDWLSLSEHQSFKQYGTCPKCNTKTTLTDCSMRFNHSLSRILERCPVCSIIKDIPAHWEVTTDMSELPLIRFKGKVFERAVCGLMIAGTDDSQNKVFLVDSGSSAEVVINIAQIDSLPRGPFRISLLVYCEIEFGILTVAMYSQEVDEMLKN